MAAIETVHCREILDSRGRPTLAVRIRSADGDEAEAAVPSGASTGSREARELRDGDPERFGGVGVRDLAGRSSALLTEQLRGTELSAVGDQRAVDEKLAALDGTSLTASPDDETARWATLGGNVAVGTSMAAARLIARRLAVPLWELIHRLLLEIDEHAPPPRLPVPHFNVINGGAHAANQLDFQEFMLAPLGAPSLSEAVRAGSEVYAKLRHVLVSAGHTVGLGDEGGFAPAVSEPAEAFELIVAAIEAAGYEAGTHGVAIALDPAANGFLDDSSDESERSARYTIAGRGYDVDGLTDYYAELASRFPIWSLEDGLTEDDWDGWTVLTGRLGDRLQLVGDDIFVTDPALIRRGVERHTANAALIKLNQIGTVSQTVDALSACERAGWQAMVSHRSGETTDTFIADLVVGSGCGQIKSGAPARGERVAKYNRLLDLDAEGRIDASGLTDRARIRVGSTSAG